MTTKPSLPILLLLAMVAVLPAGGCVLPVDAPDEMGASVELPLAGEPVFESPEPGDAWAGDPDEDGLAARPGWGQPAPAERPGSDADQREDPEPDPWTPKTEGPHND